MSNLTFQPKTVEEQEFGDFQTPAGLAIEVAQLLASLELRPQSILEPTCGMGNLLFAALQTFPDVKSAAGVDISPLYVASAKARLSTQKTSANVEIKEGDFFTNDWGKVLDKLPDPLLVIGNPPWVTNAHIGLLGGSNLPEKSNFQKHAGFDAMTGKSNFDISEWMLLQSLSWLDGRNGVMAILCKTGVARKLLTHANKQGISLNHSAMYRINALKHFGAAVDACLFVCRFSPGASDYDCDVYDEMHSTQVERTIGPRDGNLIAKVSYYERWKHLMGEEIYKWRSGVKHDCSKVMEFTKQGDQYRNGFGEVVDLEDTFLYPMLKTSQVAKAVATDLNRYMLVTQRTVGEDTQAISSAAPKTWAYLEGHARFLDARGSSIYKNRPRFSVFGIGDYSFSPWKVGISGFYKQLQFQVIGNVQGKPIVLDDASYFISCDTQDEAELLARLLNSQPGKEFFEAFVFWDGKRPITIEHLRRLNVLHLAKELGVDAISLRSAPPSKRARVISIPAPIVTTPSLFETLPEKVPPSQHNQANQNAARVGGHL